MDTTAVSPKDFFSCRPPIFWSESVKKGRIIRRANAVRPRAISCRFIRPAANPNLTGEPSMPDRHRNAFGRLLVDPATLNRAEQIACLRVAAGMLQALDALELRWVGRALAERLREGGDLEVALGLRPPRGSRATAEALGRSAEINRMLVQLAHAVGAPRASRILRGTEQMPPACAGLVAKLRALRAPCSEAAFDRARRASRDRR